MCLLDKPVLPKAPNHWRDDVAVLEKPSRTERVTTCLNREAVRGHPMVERARGEVPAPTVLTIINNHACYAVDAGDLILF